MKKFLFFIVLTLCILLGASAVADEPLLEVSFSNNAADTISKGDVVVYTLKCENIKEPGLSSYDLIFDYSEGLSYNNDCSVASLPEGWVLWDPVDKNGEVRVGVIDESVVSAGFDNMELTLSFTVISEDFTEESVVLSQRDFYDFDLNLREDYTFADTTAGFFANMPDVTLENIGASLRLNHTPALRFGAKLSGESEGIVFGMLVCESDKLEGELSHTTDEAKVYTFTKPLFDNTYSTPAIEVSSNTEKYTFRPFVTFTTKNTQKSVNILFDELSRSVLDVAQLALENETDSSKTELLGAIISGT